MSSEKYDTKDLNLRLRQAAGAGDLEEVRHLIVNHPVVKINASGPQSQQTALHRAAANNHYEVARYLIAQGADARLPDKKGNTPAQCCKEEPLKSLLTVAYPLQQAILFAKNTFSESTDTPSAKAATDKARERISATSTAIYKDVYPTILEKIKSSGCIPPSLRAEEYDKQQQQFNEHSDYTYYLIKLRALLEYAHRDNYRLAHCGELAGAAAAFLIVNNITGLPIHDVSLHDGEKGGHEFLVIGKPSNISMGNVKLSNAVICDPYQPEHCLYSIKHTPPKTCVNGIDGSFGYTHQIQGQVSLPDGTGFLLGRKFFEEVWREQIDIIRHIIRLYAPAIELSLPGKNEEKKKEATLSI